MTSSSTTEVPRCLIVGARKQEEWITRRLGIQLRIEGMVKRRQEMKRPSEKRWISSQHDWWLMQGQASFLDLGTNWILGDGGQLLLEKNWINNWEKRNIWVLKQEQNGNICFCFFDLKWWLPFALISKLSSISNDLALKKRPFEVSWLRLNLFDVPPTMPSSGLEPETSPLPRECSTAELQGLVEMMGRVGFEPT